MTEDFFRGAKGGSANTARAKAKLEGNYEHGKKGYDSFPSSNLSALDSVMGFYITYECEVGFKN